jgi:hypothetical protein
MRRLGLRPREPEQGGVLLPLKVALGRLFVWAKRRFRGYKPPPGFVREDQGAAGNVKISTNEAAPSP